MSVRLLPDPWKPWHPVVFGFLAMIGAMLAAPVVDIVMSAVRGHLH